MARARNVDGRDGAAGDLVQGRSVATLGRGMALVKVGKSAKVPVRPEDNTTVLVKKAARALNKPGIDRSVVFRGPNAGKIYSYAAYAKDPTKVVREAADGTRVIGRVVDGKFRPVKE
ncbi:hypothetical protein QTH97_15175 [Variovorax sp. J22R24]|uniref:hypothetical protein n=1 Tax=Variovorax gracilis TaxID=3053502 RepID=UPI002574D511|nr:hypothetical protein [Variovorax sp. J22R24]MDM0106287.1 hypothetical protein [Variovorax sp. J22R24]